VRSERLASLPTAPLAASGLIAGFAVAQASGSRPLGGVVLGAFGLGCIAVWLARDERVVAAKLTGVGLSMFVLSHLLGLAIGAWPSVLLSAGVVALACDRLSDAPARARRA
jgi:tetrahydromethanopterin S-methyltransferase subunit C